MYETYVERYSFNIVELLENRTNIPFTITVKRDARLFVCAHESNFEMLYYSIECKRVLKYSHWYNFKVG